ncbi:restriction endonuclease subunit S [Enterococcus casseliflavus]|uniref:restriction endonuclease subunit S n=1 Tax=Enterococcus casseliflavus TaxID=37734 RepID=UPI001784CC9A|nr:restriction endonuclease subunit S [Enterococcus casseliflavus]QOG29296.1 restriction endonuclease subunit S [Enterococcus casseliflavus]
MSNDIQPEIRFPGFTEAWEQRKLGEIVQITMGQSPNSENYTENPEDYILVQGNADMKNNRVVPRVWTTQITKQAEKGDLILSVRAPVGDIGKTDYDVVLGRGVAAIKGNDFIFQQLGKMKESGYWNRFSTGSTFESINSNDIREALITIPTGEEQQKIGTFFKQLDDTIALQQRKLDLLKETKKGFLQKMFPKNGAKVPEIRFSGFTEDWEQRKLGEIVRISSGFTGDSSLNIGQYELTRIETIATGQVNPNKVGYSNTEPDKKYLLDKGDILFSNINSLSHIGKIALFDLDMKLYHGINLLRLQPMNVNSQFLYQSFQLNNHLEWAKSHANQAVSQASINQTELSKQVFLVPSQQEQQKIGTFFKQLDDTITLHQRKLDLLKETKKGFLQKMFV